MEEILGFATAVIVISASGVMSPGPLFAANIFYGLKGGIKSGLKISYGHTIVELPLIVLLGLGAFSMEMIPNFRDIIAIIGAIGLFAFAGIQIKSVLSQENYFKKYSKFEPFKAGVFLSALNPFFIIWWLTIGFKLISDALWIWSFWGIAILFAFHIWMDYAWLSGTAYLSNRSLKFLSNKNYRFLILGISVALIYFGIRFLIDLL